MLIVVVVPIESGSPVSPSKGVTNGVSSSDQLQASGPLVISGSNGKYGLI